MKVNLNLVIFMNYKTHRIIGYIFLIFMHPIFFFFNYYFLTKITFFYLAENYVLDREVCKDFGNNEIYICKVFDWKVLV